MKTWNDIKLNDYIYVLVYHKNNYIEIRRCKVIDVKDLTKEYIKIRYTHPLNKDLDSLRLQTRDLLVHKKQYVSENDWKNKKYKFLIITEFNENIIKEFETIHGI